MRPTSRPRLVLVIGLLVGCQESIELDPGTSVCAPIGQTCADSSACCSHACADDGNGVRICQAVGGCLGAGETCETDDDCCGQLCSAGRCMDTQSCAVAGEICAVTGDPSATRACCPGTGSADLQCHSGVGIDRCRARSAGACSDPGAACDAPEECCSTICLDTGSGTRTCQASCRTGGESCTRSADCCTGTCHGALCTGMRVCAPLGASCAAGSDCCSGTCTSALCAAPPV